MHPRRALRTHLSSFVRSGVYILFLLTLPSLQGLELSSHVPIAVHIPKPPSRTSSTIPVLPKALRVRSLLHDDRTNLADEEENDLLRHTTVTLCNLNWAAYRKDPASAPMFRDVINLSKCNNGEDTITVSFAELENEYEKRQCSSATPISRNPEESTTQSSSSSPADHSLSDSSSSISSSPTTPLPNPDGGCVPTGMIFHQSRCGSTLMANMVAVLPDTITYSESNPPSDILNAPGLSEQQRIRALRVIVAAMGRPVAMMTHGKLNKYADPEWQPYRLFFKFQSALSLHIATLRKAFPISPWTFIHRDGIEIMASLFRGAASLPPSDASVSQHVSAEDMQVRRAPCMRSRDIGPPKALLTITNSQTSNDAYALPAEDFCAASLSLYAANALFNAREGREQGLTNMNIYAPSVMNIDLLNGEEVAYLAENSNGRIVAAGGMLLDSFTGRGILGGIGQGVFLDYVTLPDAVIGVIQSHFGITVADEDIERMYEISGKYSKARGALPSSSSSSMTGKSHLRLPSLGRSMDKEGNFIDDSEEKQARAWPALKYAAMKYLYNLRQSMIHFNTPIDKSLLLSDIEDEGLTILQDIADEIENKGNTVPGTLAAATLGNFITSLPSTSARDPSLHQLEVGYDPHRHVLPLGQGYPMLFPLSSILGEWSSDITSVPPTYGRYSSLRVFDWLTERDEANRYRRAEVPFIVRNIPSLRKASLKWSNDEELLRMMGPDRQYNAEVNDNNHFMYYNKGRARRDRNANYKPPTQDAMIATKDWLKAAYTVAEEVVAEERLSLPAWWFANCTSAEGQSRIGISEPVIPPERKKRTLHYMRASAGMANMNGNAAAVANPVSLNSWISDELRFFDVRGGNHEDTYSKDEAPFFILDDGQQRGIHCRFGMPGIIAESHYDGGRNFITMERGHKRYILSPPSECNHLHLLKDGPSARHSEVDWSDPSQMYKLSNALATEIVIGPGDALYVPALWFHYITSLDVNIQCNSRSGTPRLYEGELKECGFTFGATEELGKFADKDSIDNQPSRSKHIDEWRSHWPNAIEIARGLGEENLFGMDTDMETEKQNENSKTDTVTIITEKEQIDSHRIMKAIISQMYPTYNPDGNEKKVNSATGTRTKPTKEQGETGKSTTTASTAHQQSPQVFMTEKVSKSSSSSSSNPSDTGAYTTTKTKSSATTTINEQPLSPLLAAQKQRAAEAINAAAQWAIAKRKPGSKHSSNYLGTNVNPNGKGIRNKQGKGSNHGYENGTINETTDTWIQTLKNLVMYAFLFSLIIVGILASRWYHRIVRSTRTVIHGLEGRGSSSNGKG